MKSYAAFFTIVLAVAAIANPLSAAPKTKAPTAHPVVSVERSSSNTITRGTPSMQVWQSLGTPAERLGDNVWIYHGFNAGTAQSRDDDCSTLVVTFTNDRVSDLKLVNEPAVQVLAKQMDAKKSTTLIASGSK